MNILQEEKKCEILIVDDQPAGRDTLGALLRKENCVLRYAENGPEALRACVESQPDLILLDVMMPGMDGFEVCRKIRGNPLLREIPVLIITALDDQSTRLEGLEAGADDFISKPYNRAELRARVRTILRLNRYRHLVEERTRFETLFQLSPDGIILIDMPGKIMLVNQAVHAFLETSSDDSIVGQNLEKWIAPEYLETWEHSLESVSNGKAISFQLELDIITQEGRNIPTILKASKMDYDGTPQIQVILHDITEQRQKVENERRAFEAIQQALEDTINGWAKALELRDQETEGHTQRVTDLSVRLARVMGISERDIVHTRRGAVLHDIGKMGVPDSILLKPGRLTDEEMAIMKQHPILAYKMLSKIDFIGPSLVIPVFHHERWDGSGYPFGYKGTEIPLDARLFAIVDVWDALTSERPYHVAWEPEKVFAHLRAQSGSHFDPLVVDKFIEMMREDFPAPSHSKTESDFQ